MAFGVSLNSVDDFQQLSSGANALKARFDAGAGQSFEERRAAMQENSSFTSFVQNVTAKGFFHGLEEGSLEYLKRYEHMMDKFEARVGGSTSSSSSSDASKEEEEEKGGEEEAKAEKKKGDNAVRGGNFEDAVAFYSNAIRIVENKSELSGMYSILLANRAAAETHLQQFEEALNDCEKSCELDPGYVKAWSRRGECLVLCEGALNVAIVFTFWCLYVNVCMIGLANYKLGYVQEALNCYEEALRFCD